jgi:hypothetical protein
MLRNKREMSKIPAGNRTRVLAACVETVPMSATTAGLLDGRLVPEASSENSETRHEERGVKSDPASGVTKRTEVAECSGICGVGEPDAETLLAKKLIRTFNELGQV